MWEKKKKKKDINNENIVIKIGLVNYDSFREIYRDLAEYKDKNKAFISSIFIYSKIGYFLLSSITSYKVTTSS